jgi:hypothetical protein
VGSKTGSNVKSTHSSTEASKSGLTVASTAGIGSQDKGSNQGSQLGLTTGASKAGLGSTLSSATPSQRSALQSTTQISGSAVGSTLSSNTTNEPKVVLAPEPSQSGVNFSSPENQKTINQLFGVKTKSQSTAGSKAGPTTGPKTGT